MTSGGTAIPSGREQQASEHSPTSAKVQKTSQSDKCRSCVGKVVGLCRILVVIFYKLTLFGVVFVSNI